MGSQQSNLGRFTWQTPRFRCTKLALLLGCTLGIASALAHAQGPENTNSLPNAPQPVTTQQPVANLQQKYIQAGFTAQPLTARGKVAETMRDLYTPESFIGFAFAAGYSHGVNGQPNYGTDRGAFGERLGAAAIRDTSQNIFSNAVFAPLLHQDPRYYVEGDRYSVGHRIAYALSRSLITRRDDGRTTVNTSLIFGYAAAAALTQTYYPVGNRDAKDSARTFGASIGGAAVSFAYHEFLDDGLVALHLRKRHQQ